MDIMWEDTGSECIDSRPNGQKTRQKKVTLFGTYLVVVIRNICNTANNSIVGKYIAVTELEVINYVAWLI